MQILKSLLFQDLRRINCLFLYKKAHLFSIFIFLGLLAPASENSSFFYNETVHKNAPGNLTSPNPDNYLSKALNIQYSIDSLLRVANETDDKRKKYLLNKKAKELQDKIKPLYEKAYNAEKKYISQMPSSINSDDNSPSTQNIIYEFESLSSLQDKNKKFFVADTGVPDGIIYRIQLGVYQKDKKYDFFKGFFPVFLKETPDSDVNKYSLGLFSQYDDAYKALRKVRSKGFRD